MCIFQLGRVRKKFNYYEQVRYAIYNRTNVARISGEYIQHLANVVLEVGIDAVAVKKTSGLAERFL